MKKDSNFKTILAVNMIILTVVALNKSYKPMLEKLAIQYKKFKKENLKRRNQKEYKMKLLKLLKEIQEKIENVEDLIIESLQNQNIQETFYMMSNEVQMYLCDKLENDYIEKLNEIEISELSFNSLDTIGNNFAIETSLSNFNYLISEDSGMLNEIDTSAKLSNFANQFFLKHLCVPMALIISLNSLGNIKEETNLDTEIIMDLESYFSLISTDILSVNDVFFDSFNRSLTVEQKIYQICSNSTSYQEAFSAILALENISIDEKIKGIVSSNITTYDNIFHFILSCNMIENKYEKIEYILSSDVATSEEKTDFILQNEEFTLHQKIWYVLLMPNQSFEDSFHSLLSIEDISQEQIIRGIILTDLISFEVLFDNILTIEDITKEEFIHYLSIYQADYNAVSLESKASYVLKSNFLNQEEKVDCIWNLMDCYSLEEKVNFVLSFYHITYEDYISMYYGKQKNLTEEQLMIFKFFDKINEEKENYILSHYSFDSKEQLEFVVACCAAEGANHYDDLYWVSNTIFNRITHPDYVKRWTNNPYLQIIAPNQFAVYSNLSYQKYLLSKDSSFTNKYALAKQAFYDMFYNGYEGIEHNYTQFRSWGTTDYSNNCVVVGGNRYSALMSDSIRIQYENIKKEENVEDSHILTKKLVSPSMTQI